MATEFPIRANTKNAVKDITALENALRKAGKEANLTEKEIEGIISSTKKAKSDGGKNLNAFNTSIEGINKNLKTGIGLVTGYFSVQQAKAFIGELIKITSEFQKLEALLTNTLGSRSAALKAFVSIKEQAAKTNFALTEVAGGYLKLANNGIKPTNKELTAFFDLTNNAGKSFDQFVEAVNDATRGEFERLKEFYVSASNQGEKVIFTFKGQTFEAKRNAESIKDVLVQLGELNGVAGSTASISATLEGRISNLGDGWDTFMAQLGQGNSGALFTTVSLLSEMVRLLQLVSPEGRGALSGFDSTFLSQFFGEDVIGQGTDAFGGSLGARTSNFLGDIQKFFNEVIQSVDVKTADLQKIRKNIANELDAIAETHGIQFKEEGESVRVATRLINSLVEASNRETEEGRVKSLNQLKAFLDTARALRLKEEEKHAAELRKEYEALAKARDKFLDDLDTAALIKKFQDSQKAIDAFRKSQGLTFSAESGGGLGGFDSSLGPDAELGIAEDPEFEAILKRKEQREKEEIAQKESIDHLRDYTIDAFEQVFRSRVINSQRQLALLESQYHHELSLAGNNEEAKAKLTREFEQQRIAILNKQAQQEQLLAFFSMAANQGPAIVKAIATAPFPINLGIGAAIAALIGVQIANQRKLQAPRFAAEGEFNIQGPGTTTSDSIPYMLSREESVVKAERSKRFGWLLQPMIENNAFDEYDLRNLVDQKLPNQYNPVFVSSSYNSISQEQLDKLDRIERAIMQKKETHLTYDQEGFNIWLGNENKWTRKRNRRYST